MSLAFVSLPDDQSKIEFIATCFANNERGEDVAAKMGVSPAWISIHIKKYAPELRGKGSHARQQAAIAFLNGRRSNSVKFAKPKQDRLCPGYVKEERRICGELLIRKDRQLCRRCWINTIPDGFRQIMTPSELNHYINTKY